MSTPDYRLLEGDALEILATLPDESVDAVVTDPPYGLAFMNYSWDTAESSAAFGTWCQRWAEECLRVLKPGGHLVAFGGSRTWHRLAAGVEDAGFELRDSLMWIYGSGFPKGMDVAAAIDRQRDDRAEVLRVTAWLAAARDEAGWTNRRIDEAFGLTGMAGHWTTQKAQPAVPTVSQWARLRELLKFGDDLDDLVARLNDRKGEPGEAWHTRPVVGTGYRVDANTGDVPIARKTDGEYPITTAALDEARRWEGWKTALKPAHEPIVLARKPLAGNVARNVTQYGTGAMNIDACRITATDDYPTTTPIQGGSAAAATGNAIYGGGKGLGDRAGRFAPHSGGRWPANVVLSHGPACELDRCVPGCPVAELDEQSGHLTSGANPSRRTSSKTSGIYGTGFGQECTPARGADSGGASRFFPVFRYQAKASAKERPRLADGTAHPTVKPLDLMRWLVRLVTPPGGLVLEPFAGSGTTVQAALLEGFRCVAIEREPAYCELIRTRLDAA